MSKKHIQLYINSIIVSIILISCTQGNKKVDKTNTQDTVDVGSKSLNFSDISDIEITVSRGAFHWDSFQLIGNELTYHPSEEKNSDEYPEYQEKSSVMLSDSIVRSLIKGIIKNNILELDTYYDNMTSCSSILDIEIKIDTIQKKIACKDYKRGCPNVLINLESKLIKLHGKNLKRIFLPG